MNNNFQPHDRQSCTGEAYYNQFTSQPPVDESKRGLNIASLVLGIFSLAGNLLCCFCLTPVAAILSIIFACVGRENHRFHAYGVAGLICSLIFIALFVLLIIFYIVAVMTIPEETWRQILDAYRQEMEITVAGLIR